MPPAAPEDHSRCADHGREYFFEEELMDRGGEVPEERFRLESPVGSRKTLTRFAGACLGDDVAWKGERTVRCVALQKTAGAAFCIFSGVGNP